MEYERLIYKNERGESLEFNAVNSLYHCNVSIDVSGISDVKNTIYSSNSMGQHGDTFIGQRIEPREIAITGALKTRDKAQAYNLRRQAIKILNPDLQGKLTYIFGDFVRVIDCRIDDSPEFYRKQNNVFNKFDITFNCLNPFWREEEEIKEDIASWVAAWEFPCEIEEDNDESMIFGYREESVIVDCYNAGDVSTGMRIKFTALGTVVNPILLNVDTQEYIQINATLQTGDVVEITTEYGSKGATLTRKGETSDYFRYIDVDSTFMQLEIGDNVFRYDAEGGVNSLEVSLFYSAKYLGV
ncbi:MAG: phage tail family protein [Clostridia bacterium]|nr:phage tail family protein [Clostridia bacterium]